MKIKNDLPLGTERKNHASIYFDYNNAITPNGDLRNEYWRILNLDKLKERDITVKRIVIYNRWGQVVGEDTSGDYLRWQPFMSSTDVFAYMIAYSVHSGNEYTQTGNITVIQ